MKKSIKEIQKNLYDGKDSGYRPVYEDRAFFAEYLKSHVAEARDNKILGISYKAARNIKELEKLELKSGMKVLDAGCGPGILINQLEAMYKIKGYGCDLSKLALKRAKECGSKKIIYKNSVLEKMPFPKNYFDAVVSFDVLEHVENKEKVLSEMARVLKPGGKLLIYAISIRDLFTWHWFLRLITFGRLGHDTEGGHFREQFAEPYRTAYAVSRLGCEGVKTGYLHSFFTLLADELLFKMFRSRVKTANAGAGKSGAGGGRKIKIYRFFQATLPVMELLELPWKIFGLSNGFFVRARKKT
ncbi:MAG TPA: class I SAM-dependent methyltransferase [Candidatus Goldiibacteriota bacterium]|nr:class I SAM-dependent methyltransferase [Candidatus Goldiibacteriota bacterium]